MLEFLRLQNNLLESKYIEFIGKGFSPHSIEKFSFQWVEAA